MPAVPTDAGVGDLLVVVVESFVCLGEGRYDLRGPGDRGGAELRYRVGRPGERSDIRGRPEPLRDPKEVS